MMDKGDKIYSIEQDGTIQKWYVCGWIGNRIGATIKQNPKLRDYTKYFDTNDFGKTFFCSRKDAEKEEAARR